MKSERGGYGQQKESVPFARRPQESPQIRTPGEGGGTCDVMGRRSTLVGVQHDGQCHRTAVQNALSMSGSRSMHTHSISAHQPAVSESWTVCAQQVMPVCPLLRAFGRHTSGAQHSSSSRSNRQHKQQQQQEQQAAATDCCIRPQRVAMTSQCPNVLSEIGLCGLSGCSHHLCSPRLTRHSITKTRNRSLF